LANSKSVAGAAGILVLAGIASRILGYIRDMVLYARFGQNAVTDAYNAAFSIPDFLYLLLVGGALSSAFIPVFGGYLARKEREDAVIVASTIFNLVLVLMTAGIALGMVYTPLLIQALVPGFDDSTQALTVQLTRIMLIQALFMGLSGLTAGILQANKRFLAPAVGSVLYNLGTVVVGYWLSLYFGIAGFSIGVVCGAVLYLVVQIPNLIQVGFRYRPMLQLSHPGVRRIGRLIVPVLLGLSVTQLNLFVNQYLASGLAPGIVAALRTAQRLMQLPIGIFAVAFAVAAFPTLTSLAATGQLDSFKRTTFSTLSTIFFITVPAAVGLIALRVPIIRVLYQIGQFTPAATETTAVALFFYSLGIFGWGSIQLLNRTFYALEDTRTPVFAGILAIGLNIALNVYLVKIMGHGGLALAYSLTGVVNMLILILMLRRRLGSMNYSGLLYSFGRILFASLVMGLAASCLAGYLELVLDMSIKLNQLWQVLGSVSLGVTVYALLALALKMPEARVVLARLRRK